MACIVIRDRFGDLHATRDAGGTRAGQLRRARSFAQDVSCDAGEHVAVYLCTETNDAGAARLRPLATMRYLGTVTPGER